jgi:hypothetical protein
MQTAYYPLLDTSPSRHGECTRERFGNKQKNGKSSAFRLGKLVLWVSVIGVLAIAVASMPLFQRVVRVLNAPRLPAPSAGANVEIAYPLSTHLCLDGCRSHENWIVFYLPTNGSRVNAVRLKTSLFFGQILTVRISAGDCEHETSMPGYTCFHMELSHRLLRVLTTLDLAPLPELQDKNNWWLEYTRE